jgi:hypothetical protein
MWKLSFAVVVVLTLLLSGVTQAARDVTAPGDVIQGVPNDGISTGGNHGWPGNEAANQAIDNQIVTKYLHFKGDIEPTGIRVTPKGGPSVVTSVRFCSANDTTGYPGRAPITYELSGSNVSIDGPYTLIASGDIKDFAGPVAWPNQTWTTTPMKFANTVAYKHYQLMFPTIWNSKYGTTDTCMQIAEIELLETVYKATATNPLNGATGVLSPLFQWTAGDTAVSHDVYFGTNPTLGTAEFMTRTNLTVYWYGPGLTPGATYYWRVDEVEADGVTIHKGDVWSFTAATLTAHDPTPRDGDKWIDVGADLSWVAGATGIRHDVYFGTSQTDVANGTGGTLKSSQQTKLTYDPGTLALNTTYYWRIDEYNAGGTKFPGKVWSFTTTGGGGGLKGEYFNNTDLSGLPVLTRTDTQVDLTLTGTTSPGAPVVGDGWSARWTADLDIAIADTYMFSVNCQDGTRLWIDGELIVDKWVTPTVTSKYFSLPISLEKGIHSLRLEFFDSGGDAVQQLYWSTPTMAEQIIPAGPLQPPLRAGSPNPPDGAADVKQTPVLRWDAGLKAAKHNVYLGTDAAAVENATTASAGIYRGQQDLAATTYVPTEAPLAWNSTYYWRIDEVNAADTWKGNVWSFTTADFIVVDDFEDYTDDVGSRIFQTWRDGWGFSEPSPGYPGNGTGSAVGYAQPTFVEMTTIHGGAQSMPLAYDNSGITGKARYSETQREWTSPQDWTMNGVKALTLYFYGASANAAEQLYVAVEDNAGHVKVVNHPEFDSVLGASWHEWNIELTQFSAAGVNLKAIKKMYIGLGNRTSPTAGGTGTLFIDDIRVYPSRCVPSMLKPAADLNDDCVVDYLDLEVLANDWLLADSFITTSNPGAANLAAQYRFDGDVQDSSGKGNNGTINGDPTWVAAGKVGSALRFDGDGDYVDCGAGATLNITNGVTIAAWIKLSVTGLDQKIVGNQDNSTGGYKMTVYTNDRVEFEIRTSAGAGTLNRTVAGGTALATGVWYHVVGVYSEGGYLRTYVNGVLDRELITTAVLGTSTGTLKIGCEPYTTTANFFNGIIDDLRIYNKALSAGEIAYLGDETPADGKLYVPVPSVAELYSGEPQGSRKIDLKDYAELADAWLEEILWP